MSSTATLDDVTSEATGHEALVGPEWIAARIDDPSVRIVEVDVSPAAFDSGHIPGAAFWNAYGDLRPAGYRPLDASGFARLLAGSDIGPDTTVVLYGYGAYLGYWLMRSHGHARVFLMDGPRERWLEAGHAWAGRTDLLTREQVLGLLGDPDAVLVDVRSREEFIGERFWPSGGMQEGGRAGHIPGAVWLPVDIARQSPEQVRQLCEAAGVGPDRHVAVYCTIGNRASQVWYVLKHLLGYPRVSVYYGSWAEWGMSPEVPVEAGTSAD